MSEGKKQYEISFLTRNEGDKEEITKALAAIDAEITVSGKYSEIRLAYPVKKQTVAYFGFIDFMADADKITSLDASLRFNERVLRCLIITPPPRKPIPRVERRNDEVPVARTDEASVIPAEKEAVSEEVLTVPEAPKEVSDELLDQKLDEILN